MRRIFQFLLLIVAGIASASDLPYYESANEPYWWNRNRLAVTQVQVTESPGAGNITLRVTYEVKDKNGNVYITADGDYTFSNGTLTSNLPTPSWWFDPRFNPPAQAPYTLTIKQVTRPGFGPWNGPVSLQGDRTLTMTNLGEYPGDRPVSAITDYYTNATLIIGAYNDCPPRENLKFHLDYSIGGTGQWLVELEIDGQTRGAVGGEYDGLGGPPLEKVTDFGPFQTASGAFEWKVKANGQVVASGSVGCEDEILNDTINVFFDFVISNETEPGPKDEKPDPDKEQPPPSNTNPNPDGMQPGTAPPIIKPPGTGLPVEDPAHNQYKGTKQALIDAGNEGTFPGDPYTSGLADYDSELAKRGRLDDIEGKLADIEAQAGSVQAGLLGLNEAGSAMDALVPKGIGKINQWFFASFNVGGRTVSITLDMTPFLPIINQLREVLRLFVYIWFIWCCGKEIVDAM